MQVISHKIHQAISKNIWSLEKKFYLFNEIQFSASGQHGIVMCYGKICAGLLSVEGKISGCTFQSSVFQKVWKTESK